MKYDFSNLDKFPLVFPAEPDNVEVCLMSEDKTEIIFILNTNTNEIIECDLDLSFDCLQQLKEYLRERTRLHNQSIIDSF